MRGGAPLLAGAAIAPIMVSGAVRELLRIARNEGAFALVCVRASAAVFVCARVIGGVRGGGGGDWLRMGGTVLGACCRRRELLRCAL